MVNEGPNNVPSTKKPDTDTRTRREIYRDLDAVEKTLLPEIRSPPIDKDAWKHLGK